MTIFIPALFDKRWPSYLTIWNGDVINDVMSAWHITCTPAHLHLYTCELLFVRYQFILFKSLRQTSWQINPQTVCNGNNLIWWLVAYWIPSYYPKLPPPPPHTHTHTHDPRKTTTLTIVVCFAIWYEAQQQCCRFTCNAWKRIYELLCTWLCIHVRYLCIHARWLWIHAW